MTTALQLWASESNTPPNQQARSPAKPLKTNQQRPPQITDQRKHPNSKESRRKPNCNPI